MYWLAAVEANRRELVESLLEGRTQFTIGPEIYWAAEQKLEWVRILTFHTSDRKLNIPVSN